MGDKVTHVITDSKWDDNFDEVSCTHHSTIFIKMSMSNFSKYKIFWVTINFNNTARY